VLWMSWKEGHMGLVRCFLFLSDISFFYFLNVLFWASSLLFSSVCTVLSRLSLLKGEFYNSHSR